jgi:hypothetical protein
MSEDESYITKQRDFAALVRAGDKDALADLFEHPVTAIVEGITGFIASGPKEWVLASGRLVQGVFKAQLFPQVAAEIEAFRKAGKIPDDFAERKNGLQTWVELFTAIDEETPDEERLEALKAMFLAVNQVNAADRDKVVGYQLFQIAKRLSSNELLVLKAAYAGFTKGRFGSGLMPFAEWARVVGESLGHSIEGLIEHADEALTANQLLTKRLSVGGVQCTSGRFTDLGIKFCENIERYQIEKKSLETG